MGLSPAAAALADEAIRKVAAAAELAAEKVGSASYVLAWVTDSESAYAAMQEDLRQTRKILDMLRAQRPTLTDAGLRGFLDLAAAGAEVSALVAGAEQLSVGAAVDQVVGQTGRDLNPFNLAGPVGKAVLFAGLALVIVLLARK